MSHKSKCGGNSYQEGYKSKCGSSRPEEKNHYHEQKREEKQRYREKKREEKQRHRQEKKELKQRHREEKRRHREEFIAQIFNLSSPTNVVASHLDSNVHHHDKIERDVATIRTIFPDCDPVFIRDCLSNETGDDHVRKVVEKLLTTTYPKVEPVSPLTPPTAPPHSPFDGEDPPSYEESMGNQTLRAPPLPRRHQKSSSWDERSQSSQSTQSRNSRYGSANSNAEITIGNAVKNLLSNFKPSTVERACHKNSYVWTRPVPSRFNPKPLSRQFKVIPKDKFSIQKGFHQNNYPSKELRSHDISEEDWHFFISGLNSLIGVNSIDGVQNNFGGISISLKWVSWMNVSIDEKQMESNTIAINEYINRWNDTFFIPRRIMVQFVGDRTNPYEGQYLLIKSV